jgi:hypothetical protein
LKGEQVEVPHGHLVDRARVAQSLRRRMHSLKDPGFLFQSLSLVFVDIGLFILPLLFPPTSSCASECD